MIVRIPTFNLGFGLVDGGLLNRLVYVCNLVLNPIKTIPDAAYTLAPVDNGRVLSFTNAAPVTLTVPEGLGKGYSVGIIAVGAGDVTPTAAGSVTISNRQGFTKTAGQFALIGLFAFETDTLLLAGDGA